MLRPIVRLLILLLLLILIPQFTFAQNNERDTTIRKDTILNVEEVVVYGYRVKKKSFLSELTPKSGRCKVQQQA